MLFGDFGNGVWDPCHVSDYTVHKATSVIASAMLPNLHAYFAGLNAVATEMITFAIPSIYKV
eukprot:6472968-Amphidinium_carterae.3